MFAKRIGPLSNCVEEQFRNAELAPVVQSPLLMIHGIQDKMVPMSEAQLLFDLFQCRKELVILEDAGHQTSQMKDEDHM